MKHIVKNILIIITFVLLFASPVYSLQAEIWEPQGIYMDFEKSVPEVLSSSGSKIPGYKYINGSNALHISHEKDAEILAQKDMSENPIVFNEYKDYVLSFDFHTDVLDGYREIMHYDGDIAYQKSRYIIRIGSDSDNCLYIKDLWGDNIAALELGITHNIECYIDGDSRRVYEIRVNGEKKDIDLYHFHYALPAVIDNFNIVQKNWKNSGNTYYDNVYFREIDKIKSGVFFSLDNKQEVSAFAEGDEVHVNASVYTKSAGQGKMFLAVYDGSILEDVKQSEFELVPGMNYPGTVIRMDSNQKTLKIFLMNDNLEPFSDPGIIKGNTGIFEYISRVKASLVTPDDIPDKNTISSYMKCVQDDGSFSNIRYSAKTTDFCYVHCDRLWDMTKALYTKGYDFGDVSRDEVKYALEKGIEYWINFDTDEFSFDNWYYEHITVPDSMGKLMLFYDDVLDNSPEIYSKLKQYMSQKIHGIDYVSKKDTGSNILQLQRNKGYYALCLEDTDMLIDTFKRINKELRIADNMTDLGDLWRNRKWESSVTVSGLPDTRTGIQSDYSYLFHGPQLMSGTYGLAFLNGISEFLINTKDLNLFPEDGIKNIIDLLLEHFAYIGRGGTLDYSTLGRSIANKGSSVGVSLYKTVYDACDNLIQFGNPYRLDELVAFSKSRPKADGSFETTVTGHKYFNKADYTVHTKGDYLFTLKSSSARTIASEALNYNNLKGRHLGDGVTFIYRTGMEYNDVFAAFDWHKLPGTTVEIKDFDPVSSVTHSYESTKSQLVGGVSFNDNGATAMELVRDGLVAKKAWFMFDDAVICLGTDINAETENDIITTVNQCLSSGDAKYSCADGVVRTIKFNSGLTELNSPEWVLHDNIGYIFNSKSTICVENCQKQGDRYDISWDGSPVKHKTEIVKRDIFSMWFNHVDKSNGSYEYIIVPNANEDMLNSYISSESFEVLTNTPSVQAARNHDEIQIIFWEGSSVVVDNVEITADNSCILSLKLSGDVIDVVASSLNPDVEKVSVEVFVNGRETYNEKINLYN